uniref:Uncharacterized protein n=1 Tax=Arundo donax TaxID=35708 RepID=A0A0A9CIY4_ARUDO
MSMLPSSMAATAVMLGRSAASSWRQQSATSSACARPSSLGSSSSSYRPCSCSSSASAGK